MNEVIKKWLIALYAREYEDVEIEKAAEIGKLKDDNPTPEAQQRIAHINHLRVYLSVLEKFINEIDNITEVHEGLTSIDNVIANHLDLLYKEAIQDTLGTISNELLWVQGSLTPAEVSMHQANVAQLEKYQKMLDMLRKVVNSL